MATVSTMAVSKSRHALVFVLTLLLGGGAPTVAAVANEAKIHDEVRKSLVHLTATGTPETGPTAGQPNGAATQGTGFFVSNDGLILTTAHFFDPLRKVAAFNIEIKAAIGGPGTPAIPVRFISDLPRLDLMLLRADLPFGMAAPAALKVGSTTMVDPATPPTFLTSGFHDVNYRRKSADLNDLKSAAILYAWTLNVKTNPGQSGSPVYIEKDDAPVVVGVIKGVSSKDDELTLMIPIEYSLPLIGHLKFQELNDRIDKLVKFIGKVTDEKPPLSLRVKDIEDNVQELEKKFTWGAETTRDGSIRIWYEKLISGDTQVDNIQLQVIPYIREYDTNKKRNISASQGSSLRLRDDGGNEFEWSKPGDERRAGEFVIPGIKERLKFVLRSRALAVGGKEPFRNLSLIFVPTVGDQQLSSKTISIVPTYTWE